MSIGYRLEPLMPNCFLRRSACYSVLRIRIWDPGTSAFLTLDPDPWSGIDFSPNPRSRIPDPNPIYLELNDKFLGTKFYNSLKIGPNFFLQHLKNKNNFQFCEICGYKKKVWQLIFFHPSLLLLFLDPGFWIRDPRSGIRDPEWVKIRIRDPR